MTVQIHVGRTSDADRPPPPGAIPGEKSMVEIERLVLRYGQKVALNGIDLSIPGNRITAFIGPSGCG